MIGFCDPSIKMINIERWVMVSKVHRGDYTGFSNKDLEKGKPKAAKAHGKTYTKIANGLNGIGTEIRDICEKVANKLKGKGFSTDAAIIASKVVHSRIGSVERQIGMLSAIIGEKGGLQNLSPEDRDSLIDDIAAIEKQASPIQKVAKQDYDRISGKLRKLSAELGKTTLKRTSPKPKAFIRASTATVITQEQLPSSTMKRVPTTLSKLMKTSAPAAKPAAKPAPAPTVKKAPAAKKTRPAAPKRPAPRRASSADSTRPGTAPARPSTSAPARPSAAAPEEVVSRGGIRQEDFEIRPRRIHKPHKPSSIFVPVGTETRSARPSKVSPEWVARREAEMPGEARRQAAKEKIGEHLQDYINYAKAHVHPKDIVFSGIQLGVLDKYLDQIPRFKDKSNDELNKIVDSVISLVGECYERARERGVKIGVEQEPDESDLRVAIDELFEISYKVSSKEFDSRLEGRKEKARVASGKTEEAPVLRGARAGDKEKRAEVASRLKDRFYKVIDENVVSLRKQNPNDPNITRLNQFKHQTIYQALKQKDLDRDDVTSLRDALVSALVDSPLNKELIAQDLEDFIETIPYVGILSAEETGGRAESAKGKRETHLEEPVTRAERARAEKSAGKGVGKIIKEGLPSEIEKQKRATLASLKKLISLVRERNIDSDLSIHSHSLYESISAKGREELDEWLNAIEDNLFKYSARDVRKGAEGVIEFIQQGFKALEKRIEGAEMPLSITENLRDLDGAIKKLKHLGKIGKKEEINEAADKYTEQEEDIRNELMKLIDLAEKHAGVTFEIDDRSNKKLYNPDTIVDTASEIVAKILDQTANEYSCKKAAKNISALLKKYNEKI